MGRRVVGKCWRKTVLMVTFVRTNLLLRMPSSSARAKRKIIKNLCLPASGPLLPLQHGWCGVQATSDHRNLQFRVRGL